jgi:hypothetical protein
VVLVVALLVVGAVITALTVDRAEPAPTPKAVHDVEWPDDIAPIARSVELIRGLRFKHAVPVRYVHASTFSLPASALDDRTRAALDTFLQPFVDFGLVNGQTDLATLLGAVAESPAGAYSPRSGVIRIYEPAGTTFARTVLAHELTHALENQNFPEKDRPSPVTPSEVLAEKGVVEGSATFVEQRYIAEWTLPFARVAHQRSFNFSADATTRNWEWFTALGVAPYVLGPAYIDATLARGDLTWNKIVSLSPSGDVVILDPLVAPSSLWQATSPRRTASVPEPTALEVFLILASRIDTADALTAVTHSSGATLSTYDRDGRRCVDLSFVTATPNDPAVVGALDRWVAAAGPANASRAAVPSPFDSVVVPARTPGGRAIVSLLKPGGPILTSCRGVSVVPFGSFTVPLLQLAGRSTAVARSLRQGLEPSVTECIAHAVLADEQYRVALQQAVVSGPSAVGDAPARAYRRAQAACGSTA